MMWAMKRLIKPLIEKKFIQQVMRFSIVGVSSVIAQLGMVAFLVEKVHIHPLNANVAGYICGFCVSFSGSRYWTFANSSRAFMSAFTSYLGMSIVNFCLNQTLYSFFLHLHMPYLPALVLVSGLCALFTFTLNRFFVFRHA